MDKNNGEYNKILIYLDEVLSIPFGKNSKVVWDNEYI